MSPAPRASLAIIGAGPRGTSLLERLGAHATLAEAESRLSGSPIIPVQVHVIDEAPSGAGRIWRTDQDRELCMNTLADAVTLFTEPGSSVSGPIIEGPTLYEWCLLVRDGLSGAQSSAIPSERAAAFAAYPARPHLADAYRDELAALLPESHPSRALYGEYLSWCYDRAIAQLPDSVTVTRHSARAIAIETVSGFDRVVLNTGEHVQADAIVLATGWMPRTETRAEHRLSLRLADLPALTWVRQGSPAEQSLTEVPGGEPVIVRGMGMGFFDVMALLTIGRGGVFSEVPGTPGELSYTPSGDEPVLHVTSHRGVPFRAKTLYGGLPPFPPQRFARQVVSAVTHCELTPPLDFDRQLWPSIVADAFLDHAETLARTRPAALVTTPDVVAAVISDALAEFTGRLAGPAAPTEPLRAAAEHISAAVAELIPDPADRLDLLGEMTPVTTSFSTPEAFDEWVTERVTTDLREAELGLDSAVKAGLWSMSAARGIAGTLGTLGGFDAESRDSGFRLLTALGGMVGSGPPAFRNRQLLALVRAGLVRFIGPDATVTADASGFTAASAAVAGSTVVASTLIDAWMHAHDLEATADPLAASLLASGRARPFAVTARAGATVTTGAFDLDPATGRLIRADGTADPVIHVAGIPVDEAVHGTIISPMPGTDPPMLRETDRVSRSALSVARDRATTHMTVQQHAAATAPPATTPIEGRRSA